MEKLFQECPEIHEEDAVVDMLYGLYLTPAAYPKVREHYRETILVILHNRLVIYAKRKRKRFIMDVYTLAKLRSIHYGQDDVGFYIAFSRGEHVPKFYPEAGDVERFLAYASTFAFSQ